ncbi:MAG TPA: hypothetical protein VMY42_27125 [Thermoguttaceae bacterium]|nr:hypothetical protein [Thermoguttaceae bacterium]
MAFWIDFWTVVLIIAVALFAGLAIVVSIGGIFDVGKLFRSMDAKHGAHDEATDADCG